MIALFSRLISHLVVIRALCDPLTLINALQYKYMHVWTTQCISGSSTPASAVVIPELDVVVVERCQVQDEFLILARGGLWGTVALVLACAFVRQRLGVTSWITMQWESPVDAKGSPDMLARELANKTVHAGSKDNVSVAIALFRDFWTHSYGGGVASSAPSI
ncbi:hypothetical protein HU200_049521 [Digitaria exilis]|uniref:protein-serine/threonine phosphatase n=1 Tax=Digitaria exilis TaxID=1010633 RepID=A0A835EB08_9POAL|nr:hypothetical protein HU200_049521 [Digitaria exilis]